MNNIQEKLEEILDAEFIDEFINLVNVELPPVRKPQYTTQYYLYNILLALTDLQKWSSLHLLHTKNTKYHFKTIQNKHLEWSKKHLYEKTYKIINQKYHLNNLKKSANLVVFIDSSNIYNKIGSSKTGYGQNPKKKESRISAICDEHMNVHSMTLIKTIKKTEIKNTFPHDSRTIESSLTDLFKSEIKCRSLKVVGDKGYALKITEKQRINQKFNTEIIYPHKRNQKEKTPIKHKKYLKKRYVVENLFAKLKKYGRICMRKDRLECTYMGFLYLAVMINFKK